MSVFPIDYPDNNPKIWTRKMTLASPVTMTSVNGAADTTPTMLDSCVIPLGIVQPGSILKGTFIMECSNNSATGTTKNLEFKMSATSAPASSDTNIITATPTTAVGVVYTFVIKFESLASQYIYNGNGAIGGVTGTNTIRNTTIDFATPRSITIWTYWSAAQAVVQTIKLFSWEIEVNR